MRSWRALAIAALVFCSSPAPGQGIIVPCGDVEGDWDWLLGGTVRFDQGNSVTWSPGGGGSAAFEGTWACDLTDGAVVIEWQHGFTDRLQVNADGSRLEGTNQEGVAVGGRRPETVSPGKAAIVDPALVGTWQLEIWLPSPDGPIPVWWTIQEDGSYVVDAGPFSHAGTMTAGDSNFELQATTSDYRDSGRYEISDWATIVAHGQRGPGRWHRREQDLKLEMVSINAQLVPSGLPAITDAARALARDWQSDALLADIDYKRRDPSPLNPPEVSLFFFSPSTGLGMWINVTTDGTRFHVASRGDGTAVPNGFLDLPQAWAVARQYGVRPPLQRAMLRVWTPEGSEPILAWSISGTGGGINIDAVEGSRLEGDLSGYVAAYNEQWQAAIAGLRRLLARPRSSSPSSSFDSWSSSSESSYDSDDGGDSGPDYGTASQNSWGAGDMRAYDRIQAGTPTGEDCALYCC